MSETGEYWPPVKTMRAAMERERAAAALAGLPPIPLESDASIRRVLINRLPRADGLIRSWKFGTDMLVAVDPVTGRSIGPWWWSGVARVVLESDTWLSFWTRKAHKAYRRTPLGVDAVAVGIFRGEIVDGYYR